MNDLKLNLSVGCHKIYAEENTPLVQSCFECRRRWGDAKEGKDSGCRRIIPDGWKIMMSPVYRRIFNVRFIR